MFIFQVQVIETELFLNTLDSNVCQKTDIFVTEMLPQEKNKGHKNESYNYNLENTFGLLDINQYYCFNKLLIYKIIVVPIWTYGIQLWFTARKINLSVLQIFQ